MSGTGDDVQFTHSSAELKPVAMLQMSVISPHEAKNMSVCEITSPLTLLEDGTPKSGGLLDPRLGTTDRGVPCATCAGDQPDCPGHFGHIELSHPCLHVGLIGTVLKVLRCVCYFCNKILVDGDGEGDRSRKFQQARKIRSPPRRLHAVMEICRKVGTCGQDSDAKMLETVLEKEGAPHKHKGCGNSQPAYRRHNGEGRISIIAEFKDDVELDNNTERKAEMSTQKILKILQGIPDESVIDLGFDPVYAHPSWFVLTVLPVSPPHVRPSVAFSATMKSSDDITYALAQIVKYNNLLAKQMAIGAAPHLIQDHVHLLQYTVATMFDNELSGVDAHCQRNGKPLKSIRQRLVGKAGRVRGNLMGKRVNFSARTVITGDPNLAIDQVGVPRSICLNLTFPERVTRFNIQKMRQLINNGPNVHPGAKTIIRDDGDIIDLRFVKKSSDQHLEVGYTVERHVVDDDPILFNRQPSLHKMSIMGHKIKVMPYSTFRLNLSCTSPYNADFDGDEMNMHVPQTLATRSEALNVMLTPRQVVSPQSNKPVMGIVQDTLLGVFKFTKRDCFMDRAQMFSTLMNLESWDGVVPQPAILKPKPLWTGKQMFSMIVPRVNVMRKSNGHPDDEKGVMSLGDTRVRIEEGVLLQGIIDKATVGASQGSLIHIIWLECGPDACRKFLTECQKVVNYWLHYQGFSVGIGDTIAYRDTLTQISKTINSAKSGVTLLISKARTGQLERQPGRTMLESFEFMVNNCLNGAVDKAGKAVRAKLDDTNNIVCMARAGSKGSTINICQIIACVGQQNVQGKRIGWGFKGRSLPHFTKEDIGPEARGFVENSYLQGLTPQELFFHAMGGREGLVDTACKTAETGYIQRRLVKAMEDVMLRYDTTVRNSTGDVVQFAYGEDGMTGEFIEEQYLESLTMSPEALTKAYEINLSDAHECADYIDPEIRERLAQSNEVPKMLLRESQAIMSDQQYLRENLIKAGSSKVYLPVNMDRLIWNAQKRFHTERRKISDLSPVHVITAVQDLCKRLIVVHGDDEISREAQKNATMLFHMMLRMRLSSKRVLQQHRLTQDAFSWLIGEVESRFYQAIAHPGEMVGPIAAQSLGEPTTQMTLNTFHFAGVSSKNVTLGVPRLREVINVATTLRTPALTVHLTKEHASSNKAAYRVLNMLEYTTLKNIVEKTEIYYDPDPMNSVVEEDREFLSLYFAFEQDDFAWDNCSPWMLRIVLNRAKKEAKQLTNEFIAERIHSEFGGELKCLYSNDNDEQLVLQVRVIGEPGRYDPDNVEDAGDNEEEARFLKKIETNLLESMSLRGVPGITKVYYSESKFEYFSEDGRLLRDSEWVLETDGTNLLGVMSFEEVESSTTVSNRIIEMFSILGIEAARLAILNEIRLVLSASSYVNYRHLAMLVDVMTFRGHLMSITRHGINRQECGPIMRCSFEETVEILVDAAAFSEPDDLKGISSNILLGKFAPIGTGSFELFLNTDLLQKHAIEEAAYGGDGGVDSMQWDNADGFGDATPVQVFDYQASPDGAGAGMQTPGQWMGMVSPAMQTPGPQAASPMYAPMTPGGSNFQPASPAYSPSYSPTSPSYSPTSPSYSPTSPSYSPTSPSYSPTSPSYSPTSPSYSPTSPSYSPTSPSYSPTSPSYSPTSPSYSPTSPSYSPTSPSYSPTSPSYSPTSPSYSPTSPSYSPTSPSYSPTSPSYSPTSPSYSPTSPSSPAYSPAEPEEE